MIEELNFNADLAIKLDNHKKVINLLTANTDESEATKIINKQIVNLMDPCLKQLQTLKKERDEAIEVYFEEIAEERMETLGDIKRKYKTIFAMLEKSKGKVAFFYSYTF